MALPTYEYRCVSCEHQFERFQRMSDEPVKECEVCGEPVRRLLFPVAIQFKGSGFYTTDYARKSALSSSGSRSENGSSESTTPDSESGNGNGHKDHAETTASASSDSSTPAKAPPATKIAS
jgi:putative FmdB family regulatory protein